MIKVIGKIITAMVRIIIMMMMIIIVRSAHWFRIIVFISANINHHHHSFLIATRIKCIYMYLPRLEKNSSVELKFTLFQSKDLAVC